MRDLLIQSVSRPVQSLFSIFIIVISVGLLATPYYYLTILPSFAIIIFILLSKYPQYGFYLIIFLIPFGAYRGLSGDYQFIKIHWIIAFFLSVYIALQIVVMKRSPANLHSNLWTGFVALFTVSLISALASEYSLTSFDNLRLLFVAILFVALNLVFISKRGFLDTLPLIIILSISVSSFLSIISYLFDALVFKGGTENFERGIGGSIDPNNMAFMIVFSLPLIVNWFFQTRKNSIKCLSLSLLTVNIISLILTYSRGGAIVLLITTSLLFIQHREKFKPKYLWCVTSLLAISIVIILVFVPTSYWERQRKITDTVTDHAIGRRISYLYVAWDAFKKDPIIGSGPGTFREIYAGTSFASQYEQEGRTKRRFAHNTYIEFLIGSGLIGITVFFIILWYALRNFHIAKKTFLMKGSNKLYSITGAYQLSFLTLLTFLFMFSDMYHKYLLISLALSQVALRLSQETKNEQLYDGYTNLNQ